MKKAVLVLCVAMMTYEVANAQILIGPAAGFHITSYKESLPGTFQRSKSNEMEKKVVDLQAGAVADILILHRLHLQSGLLFTTNSYKFVGRPVRFGVYSEYYNIRSMELPLTVALQAGKSKQGHFFLAVGGFLAYNVSGRRHVENGWIAVPEPGPSGGAMGIKAVQVPEIEETLRFGDEIGARYRRIGGGATANAGYQHKSGIFARVHYQERLVNHLKWEPGIVNFTSSNYGITVGYLLGTKCKKGGEIKKEPGKM